MNIFKKYEKIDVLSKFGPCTYVRLIIQMDVIKKSLLFIIGTKDIDVSLEKRDWEWFYLILKDKTETSMGKGAGEELYF